VVRSRELGRWMSGIFKGIQVNRSVISWLDSLSVVMYLVQCSPSTTQSRFCHDIVSLQRRQAYGRSQQGGCSLTSSETSRSSNTLKTARRLGQIVHCNKWKEADITKETRTPLCFSLSSRLPLLKVATSQSSAFPHPRSLFVGDLARYQPCSDCEAFDTQKMMVLTFGARKNCRDPCSKSN
jgi:hypothetical protein